MTKTDLVDRLTPLYETEGVGATVYCLLKINGELVVKKADVEESLQPELRDQFMGFIKREVIDNEELSILDLSSSDDRANAIYKYDLDVIPDGLESIDTVIEDDELPAFSFTEDDLSDLQAIIILIGNSDHQLALYKKTYGVTLMKRGSVLTLMKASTRFEKLDEDVLKVNDKVDFFKIDGELLIMNLKALERSFGFHDIIKKKALEGLATITGADIIDNPDDLKELIDDVAFARKLTKVTTDSPVLDESIPTSEVIEFTKTHPILQSEFQYNDSEDRIHLHTKKAKQLFLKLLNDDYLLSELTSRNYDSSAKDSIDGEQ